MRRSLVVIGRYAEICKSERSEEQLGRRMGKRVGSVERLDGSLGGLTNTVCLCRCVGVGE